MKKLSFPTVKLGNFIREVKEKVKSSSVSQDAFTVYGVTNTDGITVTNNKASDDLGNYTVLRENQFAYNPYRVNVGSIGLSLPGTFGAVSPAYVVFETNGQINNEFLLYYLKSSLGINLIKWYGDRGGVRSALRFSDLKKLDFPDITLEQQNKFLIRIQQLDKLLHELDRNLSTDRIENLRQSILQQAVAGKLCEQDPNDEPVSVLLEKIKTKKERLINEEKIKKQKPLPPINDEEKPFGLPKGWEWCRLGELANIATGSTPSKNKIEYYMYGTIPWITSSETGQEYISSARYYVTDLAVKECNLTINQPHTLVMAMYGQGKTRGQITELGIPATTNQACATISCYMSSMNPYLKIYCKKIYQEIRQLASGGAQPNLNLNKIKEYVVPCPPLSEQYRIVEKVEKLMKLCDQLEIEIANASLYSSKLIEAILQEAFNLQKIEESTQVIGLRPNQTAAETELLAAARGKIREDTWEHLRKRALEIASEES